MDHHASHAADGPTGDDGPTNALLRTPEQGPKPSPCPSRGAARLLVVSVDGTACDRLTARRTRGQLPAEVAVLVAGETRSAAAVPGLAGSTTSTDGSQISWGTVDGPGALGGIGEQVDRCLTAWDDEDGHVEVCVDAVSGMVSAADVPTVYRFLHVLMRRVAAADAAAHVHIDVEEHSRQATATLETLFDDVRTYDAGRGAWVDT